MTPLPTRSSSRLSGPPPSDSEKPDEDAISDVLVEVDHTGSIEKAARRLSKSRSTSSFRSTASGSSVGLSPLAGLGMTAVAVEEPQEMGYDDQEGSENGVDEDEDENGQVEGEYEDEEEEEEEDEDIVHLQEVVDGVWIGDLVAAMDTKGLEERGIVSLDPIHSSVTRWYSS